MVSMGQKLFEDGWQSIASPKRDFVVVPHPERGGRPPIGQTLVLTWQSDWLAGTKLIMYIVCCVGSTMENSVGPGHGRADLQVSSRPGSWRSAGILANHVARPGKEDDRRTVL